MAAEVVRTTIALPAELLHAVDRAVSDGQARSRNELVADALRRELAARQRKAIDAAFAAMADDAEYQAESDAIQREFAQSDWDALQSGEQSGDAARRSYVRTTR